MSERQDGGVRAMEHVRGQEISDEVEGKGVRGVAWQRTR